MDEATQKIDALKQQSKKAFQKARVYEASLQRKLKDYESAALRADIEIGVAEREADREWDKADEAELQWKRAKEEHEKTL